MVKQDEHHVVSMFSGMALKHNTELNPQVSDRRLKGILGVCSWLLQHHRIQPPLPMFSQNKTLSPLICSFPWEGQPESALNQHDDYYFIYRLSTSWFPLVTWDKRELWVHHLTDKGNMYCG